MLNSNMIDFLSFLEDSNYTVGDKGDIILKVPVIQINEDFQVKIPINITSNCNTTVKCHSFRVLSDTNSFSMMSFETSLNIERSNNFSISNCTIKNHQNNPPLMITDCENVSISHATISDSNEIGLQISNSIVKADNLTINNIKRSNLCIICYEKKADCIISPCCHVAGCYSCIKNWFQTKNICPICRKENCQFKKIFADF